MKTFLSIRVERGAWSGHRGYLIAGGSLTVGRSLGVDLPVRREGLERAHFRVGFDGAGATLTNLAGDAGLAADGRPVPRHGPVHRQIEAAGVTFEVDVRDFSAERQAAASRTSGADEHIAGPCSICEAPVYRVDLDQGVAVRLAGGRLFCEVCAPLEEPSSVEESTPVPERPAAELGPFEIHEELGRGATAAVYRAWDLVERRWVALKVLLPGRDDHGETLLRFQKEAVIVQSLDHPGINAVAAMGVVAGRHFVCFDYAAGRTLLQVLEERGPLPVSTALEWILTVCAALAYAHRQGIVHRDVKPGNLVLALAADGKEQVRIVDFGMARADIVSSVQQTGSGDLLGTLIYQAPEQLLRPTGVDGRADLYSVACTLFHLLTGQLPLESGRYLDEVMQAVLDKPPRPLRSLRPDLSPRLEQVLARGMEKDPGKRWPDVESFAEALRSSPEGAS